MPISMIYKHPSEDCIFCKRAKGKRDVKSDDDSTHLFRCHSVAVYASNTHDSMWVLRCEENWKKCPGYRFHKRCVKAFKKALLAVSIKVSIGRVVALPKLLTELVVPMVNLNKMKREEYNIAIDSGRLMKGCLEKYGFEKIRKTRKNRKKKMWKLTEDWYVRRS